MSGGLNILYLGPESGTCLDRANAFRRLGHTLTIIDPRKLLPRTPWVDRITWRLGGHLIAPLLLRRFPQVLEGKRFDLCYVDNGEWISAAVVRLLRRYCGKVINYNIDDPTGPRDMKRFAAYRDALREYDLAAVVRQENIEEARKLGAKNVMRVWRSADEVVHAPRPITPEIQKEWQSEVLFLGTWMPERGPFLLDLVKLGVPLTIIGTHWQKAPEWPELKPFWKRGAIYGDDYAYAIQCAKVNLGLLSKGNRDLHTTRSLEIPALGGLLCAERTTEHTELYDDNVEALFWSDAKECADRCFFALQHPDQGIEIARQGHLRYIKNNYTNESVLAHILSAALS
jgi:spore maturation protein CgeB